MSCRYLLSLNSENHPQRIGRWAAFGGALLAAVVAASNAHATQPLGEFMTAARAENFDAREQRITLQQRQWETKAATGRLLPSLSARGTFTHNQYEAKLPAGTFPGQTDDLVISPQNQLDGVVQLDVPLVDFAAWARREQAQLAEQIAEAQAELVGSELDRAVARSYFSFVNASALVVAAEQSVALAEQNLATVSTRVELGAATLLDRERASANVQRSKQDVSDARLLQILASRNLETLSGITPKPAELFANADNLQHERPLESWLSTSKSPQTELQQRISDTAEAGRKAAWRAMLPTLSANAQERFTNATGFSGKSNSYALQAVLSWRLDYTTYANARAQDVTEQLHQVQTERTARSVQDSIFEAYHRVEAGLVKSEAARAQSAAAKRAAELALQRYEVGAATQLDVTQAQRDAFLAEATRISADADLSFARASLRIVAGQPLDELNRFVTASDASPPPVATETRGDTNVDSANAQPSSTETERSPSTTTNSTPASPATSPAP